MANSAQEAVVNPWTPEPWDWEKSYGDYPITAAGRRIAVVVGDHHGADAEARLIAAAPDLYEACAALLKFNEDLCADVGVSKHYPSAEKARVALAKAHGYPSPGGVRKKTG